MCESVFRGSGELSLQALSLPHMWCCLGIPSKLLCHPPVLYPFFGAGGHTHVYCHRYKRTELLGAEGTKSLYTTTNASLQPLRPGYPFPGVVQQPTLWDSSHAVWGPTFLYWFSFVTQLPQSGCGHSEASGCQWMSLFFSC